MTYTDFESEWNNTENYITANTSGSTGIPKQIRLSKEIVKRSAERSISFFGINSRSLLYSCISPDFIGGKMVFVRALLSGAQFFYEEPSNRPLTNLPDKIGILNSEYLSTNQIDLVSLVPSQMLYLIENPQIWKGKVKCFLIGGGRISEEMASKMEDMGIEAYESYGMTETASHIALRRVSRLPQHFKTLPGIGISTDERGCLIITGVDKNKIITNDLVTVYGNDQFDLIGRFDNVINSGGKKIHPEALEKRIRTILSKDSQINAFLNDHHKSCTEGATLFPEMIITGASDKKWGEKCILCIEAFVHDKEYISDLILHRLRNFLEGWEMPKEIWFLPEFPHTANGKINRRDILNHYPVHANKKS